MRLLEARRLTGINVIWNRASAVVDVAFDDGDDIDALLSRCHFEIHRFMVAVGWQDEETTEHRYVGGASIALSAPIDALYAAVELIEWVVNAVIDDQVEAEFETQSLCIAELIREEVHPPLLELARAARLHDVAFLWDDDEVSVGLGSGSLTWPATELPDTVDWDTIHDVPIGLVTGTNGKTTTVRLATHIMRKAGHSVGLSSTDWVGVNDDIIERGDFSGPGGARTAMRQQCIDMAILETARGGLLRRGLGPERADAAVITNIAEDHLGDFGSQNLDELCDLKWIVTQALDENSVAILNADDDLLVARAGRLNVPIIWFSLDSENPIIQQCVQESGSALSVVDDAIARFDGNRWQPICAVRDIPITMQGTAKHNVANALAAVCLCSALGAPDAAIVGGLRSMTANENPGRCNLFDIDGVGVLVDFAHNPQAMAAIFDIASARPAKRRALCFSQAGDRTDRQIRELARGAWDIGLDQVFVSELADYYRGREAGEVFEILQNELLNAGARDDQVSHNMLEVESLDAALAWARPGDLVIMLALGDSANILQTVKARTAAITLR